MSKKFITANNSQNEKIVIAEIKNNENNFENLISKLNVSEEKKEVVNLNNKINEPELEDKKVIEILNNKILEPELEDKKVIEILNNKILELEKIVNNPIDFETINKNFEHNKNIFENINYLETFLTFFEDSKLKLGDNFFKSDIDNFKNSSLYMRFGDDNVARSEVYFRNPKLLFDVSNFLIEKINKQIETLKSQLIK